MAHSPQLSVIVSTYQRPGHLQLCLESLARQAGVRGQFEVVVTDDGSTDETAAMVEGLRHKVPYPLVWVTQPQEGFRLARCRNNGVRASRGEYLLFTDGDCVFDRDHLAQHLAARRPGVARAGMCVWLDEAVSGRIDSESITDGMLEEIAKRHRPSMRRAAAKAAYYQFTRNPLRPKLIGANIAVSRTDYERINGFDEAFVGWGCEDDDFAMRLRRSGVRIVTVLHRTFALHRWHPPHASKANSWDQGANVKRLKQTARLTACLNGLQTRSLADIAVRVMNRRCRWFHWAFGNGGGANSSRSCELELLVLPGTGEFSRQADCRILIVEPGCDIPPHLAAAAEGVVYSEQPLRDRDQLFGLIGEALGVVTRSEGKARRAVAA